MEKKYLKKLVGDGLNSVDIFEDPIHFNMNGNKALTSSLGGLLSILIITFIGTQAITQTLGMFNMDDPQIIQINDYEDDPDNIYLNNTNNFLFAVSTTRDNHNINMSENSFLSFTATYSQQIRSTDGSLTKRKAKVLWAPCNKSNFQSDFLPKESFTAFSLDYAFCPTAIDFSDPVSASCPQEISQEYPSCITPPYFRLRGTFLSLRFEYIQFKLKLCEQTDADTVYNLKCSSEDPMNAFTDSEIRLNLFYTNNLINSVNYDMPNKTFIDSMYWSIHPSVYKVADIFIDRETLQDFDDYFSSDVHKNSSFYSIPAEKMRELQTFKGSSLLEWNLRRSNLNHVTARRYTKILDVISDIGGISELIFVLGAMLVIGYTRYKYQMILSNELYDFQPIEEKNESPKKTSGQNPEEFISTSGDRRSQSIRQTFYRILKNLKKPQSEEHTVKDYFEMQWKKKRPLHYNELQYMKENLFCFCRKRNPEEILAEKARKHVTKDLDIIKVIEKLKEIDKLKMLLLNRDQREAFNFIEKPLITLKDESPVHKANLKSMESEKEGKEDKTELFSVRPDYDSLPKYARLYVAYRHIKEDKDPGNFKYNKNLLDMIGEDLIKVFQRVDVHMGSRPDPRKFEEIIQKIQDEPTDSTELL